MFFVFFFSSRRRHTSSYGDWSSDVCSSDLQRARRESTTPITRNRARETATLGPGCSDDRDGLRCHGGRPCSAVTLLRNAGRSEERRVGKEGRFRREQYR